MHGGLLGSKSGFVVAGLALGACQSIIGVSDYEIDRSLDEDGGGSRSDAGKPSGAPHSGAGGQDAGNGSADPQERGGHDSGGRAAAGAPNTASGDAGSSSGCMNAPDCDDGVDCTEDSCSDDGSCEHVANTALCMPSNDECVTCQLGIGCVVDTSTVRQLLLDPAFDAQSDDWIESSDNFPNNIFVEAGAQSPPRIAKFGPAPVNATEEEYADLLQHVTIPDNTVNLKLTGYYQLAPGTKQPTSDYVVAAFYEIGEREPFSQFHEWAGSSGAQATWTIFSYEAPRDEVRLMWGQDYTFDFVAHTFDSVYRFDTLSLEATICE